VQATEATILQVDFIPAAFVVLLKVPLNMFVWTSTMFFRWTNVAGRQTC